LHGLLRHRLFTSYLTGQQKAKILSESGSPLFGLKTIVHCLKIETSFPLFDP
jgi:hypothetical protein